MDDITRDESANARAVSDLMDDWLASVTSDDGSPLPPAQAETLADALAGLSVPVDWAAPGSEAPVEDVRRARYLLFSLAGSLYAVESRFVAEVGRAPRTTLVPHTPPWVRGVTSLRGDVVSVVDLRTFIGLDPTSTHTGRLLLARLPDEDFSVGLLVDRVDQIASVPADDVRPPDAPIEGALARCLVGTCEVASQFVAVLDLERFMRSPEIRQFEDVTNEEGPCEAKT
jgi:purine-binding chemotaxis protein CheW